MKLGMDGFIGHCKLLVTLNMLVTVSQSNASRNQVHPFHLVPKPFIWLLACNVVSLRVHPAPIHSSTDRLCAAIDQEMPVIQGFGEWIKKLFQAISYSFRITFYIGLVTSEVISGGPPKKVEGFTNAPTRAFMNVPTFLIMPDNAPTPKLGHSWECPNCSPKKDEAFPGMALRMSELVHSRMPQLFWETLDVKFELLGLGNLSDLILKISSSKNVFYCMEETKWSSTHWLKDCNQVKSGELLLNLNLASSDWNQDTSY